MVGVKGFYLMWVLKFNYLINSHQIRKLVDCHRKALMAKYRFDVMFFDELDSILPQRSPKHRAPSEKTTTALPYCFIVICFLAC